MPILGVINSPTLATIADNTERFEHTMRAIQGSLILASSIQMSLGFSGVWGIFIRFLSPLAMAPTIALTALSLCIYGFPQVAKCAESGFPTIVLTVIFCQYMWQIRIKVKYHFHIFELFPILLSLSFTWGFSYILTISGAYDHASVNRQNHCRTDRADAVESAPWVRFAHPFEWGPASFDSRNGFGMMASVLVSTVESTAGFYAAYRVAGATPPSPSVVSRGVGWAGIGVLLAGVFGAASGGTVSIGNIGLLAITRVGNRRVIQISAVWMLSFSVFGKFGGLFASIPVPMFAGFFCVLIGIVAAVGISSLQFTNMDKIRNLFIVGFALYMGFSVLFYSATATATATAGNGPAHPDARWINNFINVFFGSGAVIALIIAFLLDNTMRSNQITPKDRGMHWFGRFHEYSRDTRIEEFYKLPSILLRYLPPQ